MSIEENVQSLAAKVFADAFAAERTSFPDDNSGLDVVCRIFKYEADEEGNVPDQRMSITFEKETGRFKPFVFFAAPDGARMLLQHGKRRVFDGMLHLGIGALWIRDTLEVKRLRFAMIVLPDCLSFAARWDSLLDQLAVCEPTLATYCAAYRDECKTNKDYFTSEDFLCTYESIERIECASISSESDARIFLTPKRFLELTEKRFVDFRVLCHTWAGASHLFTGTGKTVDAQTGVAGVGECLIHNRTLEQMKQMYGAQVIKLDVVLPIAQEPALPPAAKVKECCCSCY